jgi:hypothetical protein
MDAELSAISCPNCMKPLYAKAISDQLGACNQCEMRILMDDRFRTAIAHATANNGLITNASWKETITNDALAILLFCLNIVRIVNLAALGIGALVAAATVFFLIRALSAEEPRINWPEFIGTMAISLIPVALFFVMARIDRIARRLLPNQFVSALTFLMSSHGFVLVAPVREPLFLPWSSIAGCSTFHDLEISNLAINYYTADGQVATLNLDPNEYGDIFDVLSARCAKKGE